MTSHTTVTTPNSDQINDVAATNTTAANDAAADDRATADADNVDNGIELSTIFEPYFRPDANTIVCGALDEQKVDALAKAGVELVINLQPDDELSFDEAAAVKRAGMYYEQLPISGAADLKQLKVLAFDNILRQYHGKKVALHCGSGNRVGAVTALRAGWLRGRKMDTAMARGRSHGLSKLEDEVYNRLLVPR